MSYRFYHPDPKNTAKNPTIVLLHGFTSSQKYWRRLIPLLRRNGYSVLTIDLLGHGTARHAQTTSYSYEAHTAHIKAVLHKANIDHPFILVGHSMGSLIAAYYALRYPGEIKHLFMLHTPLYLSRLQAIEILNATGYAYRFLLDSRIRHIGWGLLKLLPTGIAKHTGKGREESFRHIILSDSIPDLIENLSVPTSLIIGKQDRPVYQENIKRLRLPRNIDVQLIEAGHHSPLMNPSLLAMILTELSSTRSKSPN